MQKLITLQELVPYKLELAEYQYLGKDIHLFRYFTQA